MLVVVIRLEDAWLGWVFLVTWVAGVTFTHRSVIHKGHPTTPNADKYTKQMHLGVVKSSTVSSNSNRVHCLTLQKVIDLFNYIQIGSAVFKQVIGI